MKKHITVILSSLMLLCGAVSCSKSSSSPSTNNNGSGSSLTANDFKLSNLTVDYAPGNNSVYIEYDIKNVSSKNFGSSDNMYIVWTVKATDGTVYQQTRSTPAPLAAGTSYNDDVTIWVASNRTIDPSTLTYIFKNK